MNFIDVDRRSFLTLTTALLASASAAGTPASARTAIDAVDILIPFVPEGSFTKTCLAVVEASMASGLVRSATAQNVVGGGGARAFEYLVRKQTNHNDTLMLTGTSTIARWTKGEFPYKMSDLATVVRFSAEVLTFVVKKESRYRTLRDVVESLKKDPASVRFCSDSDPGLSEHLCAAKMLSRAGLPPKGVAYIQKAGEGKHITALLEGDVDVIIAASADIHHLYLDKSVRVLGISSDRRLDEFPDVPTLDQVGIPEAVFYNARWFVMSSGTSALRTNIMADLLEKLVSTPEWEAARAKGEVTMLFARLPAAREFFDEQERDVRELQKAVGVVE